MPVTEVIRDLSCQLHATVRLVAGALQLSPTQAQVIFNVPPDGISMSALSHRLGLDASTMTRIIAKLIRNGWVERSSAPEDRRVNLVDLTDLGQRLYRQLDAGMETEVQAVVAGLDAERQEDLAEHLEELTWRLLKQRQ